MFRYKIGFIGVGVMSNAILQRVIENIDSLNLSFSDILIYDIDSSKYSRYPQLKNAANEAEVFSLCEIVILAVKPQFYRDILSKVSEFNCKTIVSIMAGVKIAAIKALVSDNVSITRIMPNTPCQIGKGISAVCHENNVENSIKQLINSIFKLCGEILMLPENKFDAVTSISGSGPAYGFSFILAMINGGIDGGLSYEESKLLTIKTLEGAAALALTSEKPLEELIDSVCSKGGTTIEAINYFKEHEMESIIKGGIKACKEKSELLSSKF